ncbi:amidohydrolase family protein [Paramaledivibacter caminithermalis]|jgi:imidazolonepropionase-like amidohydrolase|uniref:Imidazolonepropionase n=1 Tax=Paramaledivibacter caminithermalis (strain DSM 15212 / CIP 107654 / DViRD3) TaxID=1121301 RepID=A0A1M6PDZ9_PARC5|nr:amidohydrolase family protein [Paramaledivibacter caminithermalis]SHK06169.1 imidazolonepropionase [Paramaledivibacter caminithermalis DSM 15212]
MLVIKSAKIYTSADRVIEKGDILIEDGKIKDIGTSLNAKGAATIDADGLIVTPGLIDAHSHISGFETDMSDQDLNEMTNNATPQVEAIYSVDTASKMFERVIQSGITTSAIAPGSGNVVGGLVCAVKSYGHSIEDMCIKNPVALKMALGGNPKGVYGKRNQMPMTRMGIAHVIRETLIKGREYLRKKEAVKDDESKMPPFDLGLENVCRVLKKEIPLKVHCEQFDMLTIISIAKEFDVEFTLDHAWGASDFYDDIVESGCKGVIYGPIGVPLLPGECGKIDIYSLVELDRRGVTCAIMTDGPILNPDVLIVQAGEVIRFGGNIERVLNMLTINPAKIIGVDDRVGSIEKGKDADIVIFKGMPAVDTNATVEYTIINGEVVYRRNNNN